MRTGAESGLVFDIKRFSVHDGPGLRTTAFLKGCTLRCLWCHSPESQSRRPEILFTPQACIGCGECGKACPEGLLASGPTDFDRTLCKGCGECAAACYPGALSLVGRIVTVDELVESLDRDRLLHEVSGGGVTLSGGEPALQPGFAFAVLQSLRRLGHHTAVETAGHVPWEDLAAVLEFTDLVLFDLKHAADEAHRRLTGAGNGTIHANLTQTADLAARGKFQLIVRLPVVPGLNDGVDDIRMMADLLARLPGLSSIELLPYHNLGVPKYEATGRTYALPAQVVPDRGRMLEIAAVFASRGIAVSVEG